MRKPFAVAIAALLSCGPVAASEQTDVMTAVSQFVDAFNQGDTKAMGTLCGDQTSIIDEFPPHEWHGPGACLQWLADYDTDAKKNGITDGLVKIGKPRHVDVTGDRAYVVVPSTYTYKINGKAMKEAGAMFTVALRKSEGRWRAVGWAWPKP